MDGGRRGVADAVVGVFVDAVGVVPGALDDAGVAPFPSLVEVLRAGDGVIVLELEADVGFEGVAEFLPAPVGDEIFEAGAGALFAVAVVAEDDGDAAADGGDLVFGDEDAEGVGDVGRGGQAAADVLASETGSSLYASRLIR